MGDMNFPWGLSALSARNASDHGLPWFTAHHWVFYCRQCRCFDILLEQKQRTKDEKSNHLRWEINSPGEVDLSSSWTGSSSWCNSVLFTLLATARYSRPYGTADFSLPERRSTRRCNLVLFVVLQVNSDLRDELLVTKCAKKNARCRLGYFITSTKIAYCGDHNSQHLSLTRIVSSRKHFLFADRS